MQHKFKFDNSKQLLGFDKCYARVQKHHSEIISIYFEHRKCELKSGLILDLSDIKILDVGIDDPRKPEVGDFVVVRYDMASDGFEFNVVGKKTFEKHYTIDDFVF